MGLGKMTVCLEKDGIAASGPQRSLNFVDWRGEAVATPPKTATARRGRLSDGGDGGADARSFDRRKSEYVSPEVVERVLKLLDFAALGGASLLFVVVLMQRGDAYGGVVAGLLALLNAMLSIWLLR